VDSSEFLAALGHHRWSLPILAELERQGGSKFITLVRRLGANQASIRQALDSLIEMGLVVKNPGYGHPMRPEYILTDRGVAPAKTAGRLLGSIVDEEERRVIGNKWALPALHAIGEGATRFSQIRARLRNITQRALAQCLKDLQNANLVERKVSSAYPPAVTYALSTEAELLVPLVESLCRR
jgi:DNA-binding HxlR family transcriptional regulator